MLQVCSDENENNNTILVRRSVESLFLEFVSIDYAAKHHSCCTAGERSKEIVLYVERKDLLAISCKPSSSTSCVLLAHPFKEKERKVFLCFSYHRYKRKGERKGEKILVIFADLAAALVCLVFLFRGGRRRTDSIYLFRYLFL